MEEESFKRSQVEEHCTVEEAQPPVRNCPVVWSMATFSLGHGSAPTLPVGTCQWYLGSGCSSYEGTGMRNLDTGLFVPLATQAHAVSLGKSESLKVYHYAPEMTEFLTGISMDTLGSVI